MLKGKNQKIGENQEVRSCFERKILLDAISQFQILRNDFCESYDLIKVDPKSANLGLHQ